MYIVVFIHLVLFVTLIYGIILYTCGENIKSHAALQIFFDAAQHPPPLQELLAHVKPQQPCGLLHADLHLFNFDFLFSHPTFHDLI